MSLPLRLKTQVRDLWTNDLSDVQKAFQALADTIGKPVVCEPEWPLLWNELQSTFPDQALFVPTIASAVVAWTEALQQIADDDGNEEWLDKMLESIGISLDLVLMAGDNTVSTTWLNHQKAFEICFPRTTTAPHNIVNAMAGAFHTDLLNAFNSPTRPGDRNGSVDTHAQSAESWAEVDGAASDLMPGALTPATTMPPGFDRSAAVTRFPQLNMVPRPEDLQSQPPYHLVVRANHRSISVECSHQASLELMSEYFKKWVKKNHQLSTKPPMVDIEMRSAIFGSSNICDHLEISVPTHDKWTTISPMLVLSFVSNVLGFDLTFQDAGSWHFLRRDKFR